MRKTVTTYTRDGCGKKASMARELRRFSLIHMGHGKWNYIENPPDLCDSCEARLIEAVEPILGSSVLDLRRPSEQEEAKPKQRSVR